MVYAAFILLAALVVFLSIKLSDYVDLLDKTTNVSGAFIGGVLLAAVTSLPELFTSFSAVLLLKENNLVTGNILGSNIFNLAVWGVCVAVCFRSFARADLGKHHAVTLLGALAVYGLIALPVFIKRFPKIGYFSIVSPFIFLVYVLVIVFTPKTEAASESVDTKLTVKQIVLRFCLCAVLLVGTSIAITYVSDDIAQKLDLGKTFAGALLLGLTTSLPELVSTVSLCRKKNFNAATGNILGSNVFNFCILFLADAFGFRKGSVSVYPYFRAGETGMQAMLLLVLGAVSTLFALCSVLIKTRAPQKRMLGHVAAISSGTVMLAAYILFLALSVALT